MMLRLAIFTSAVLLIAAVFILQSSRKKTIRVIEIIPSWRNAEVIGDGAVMNWSATTIAKYPPRSALSRPAQEPRGM